MRAAVFENFKGEIKIQNVADPVPNDDGAIIEVLATGLCRSDWHGWMGHDNDISLPHVPGHEFAGTIVEVGKNVRNLKIGDRVTVPFICACGSCGECASGNHQVCDNQTQPGFTHWGSFVQFVAIDYADTNVVLLPEEIDNHTAATLGCRFATSYRAIVDQGKVMEGQYVAIHGCGGVGMSAIMIANALGAQVIAIDIDDETLNIAQKLGAIATVNASSSYEVVDHIKTITKGGVHLSVDALGSADTCFNSVANLRKRGKHIQVGLLAGEHKLPRIPMGLLMSNELEIIGSHGIQAHKYPEMMNLIIKGKLNPKALIEKTVSLEQAAQLLPEMNKFENKGIALINSF